MRRTLTIIHDSFALAVPFRISRGTKTMAEVVTVTIAQEGVAGWGEGVPYARYGETIAAAIASIEAIRPLIEQGADRAAIGRLLPAGAARNAVDCALWDLEARLAGSSVAAMTGRALPARIVSAITIGLDTPEAMAIAARAVADVPLLKIKVDRTAPAEQIRAVRAAAPQARIIVDPNESWLIEDLDALQPVLADARIDLLEQPLSADADEGLTGFRSIVPICADEAVHVTADLDALVGRYQLVNIKLDKSGGLTEALALADAARARGFGLMVGCMVCSSLSIAPALYLAGDAVFVDLDGPLWLKADRPDGVRNDAGWLQPPSAGFWGGAGD